jgi:MFS family permease
MSTPNSLPAPSANAKRLLWAGFFAILAAGVGFGVRGGIVSNWSADFGFTGSQLGAIGGAGFSGFCFGIIISGVIVDKIGYGKMVATAFILHVLSALVTFGATPADVTGLDAEAAKAAAAIANASAYQYLYWGMFIFALGNGVLEGVANPLISTLFPQNRTHYLNILHASWPAGMVLGGVIGWTLGSGEDPFSWKIQLSLYLIPTLLYGILFLGQKFPKSEAANNGLSMGEMFKDIGVLGSIVVCFLLALFFANAIGLSSGSATAIAGGLMLIVMLLGHSHGPRGESIVPMGSFLLFVLFITHALVGSVELGTDGWIQNITGNLLTEEQGKQLFIFTSLVMFGLRFCAHFVESKLKLSPIGILFISSILAVVGLNLASGITTFVGAFFALGIYAIGKTFFWPTMLAVVGDRFPRSGAIAMSIMGGIGMMSVGMIGGPGLGYAKDRFAGEALQTAAPETFAAVKAEKPSEFLFFASSYAIDGSKLSAAQKNVTDYKKQQIKIEAGEKIEKPLSEPTATEKEIVAASIVGDRKTLVADSAIPAAMALLYLLIFLYFKRIGGYKPVRMED